jgi:predicted component of type VI protein secretion system
MHISIPFRRLSGNTHEKVFMYGELVPLGGGDAIPLLKRSLLVGRRESCDIVLRFSNVSAHHCQLTIDGGYWYVRDVKSRNGVKVNGIHVTEKRLDPGDILHIAKHRYEVLYSPVDLGAVGPPPAEAPETDIFGKSLLERAGLDHGRAARMKSRRDQTAQKSFEIHDDSVGKPLGSDDPV